ncbi:geranylgeranyl diphosphate synthase, type II [Ruminococcaceae bacterium YRB3002]|nr:geranylgeranyl diphosphate synthase, type II [Ruminococcaceae bacterium YRB3002]
MDYSEIIEQNLNSILKDREDDITVRAARYSLLAGGKRIRPKMMFMTYDMISGSDNSLFDDVLYYAATLEIIHTSSLIHDDLPCMDDDDLRRGMPTCHKQFGEGIATLAGDLLLNLANERLLYILMEHPEYAYASYKISELTGYRGMIGGQSIDLDSENKKISLEKLYELQSKKTGALIESAIITPYYLVNRTTAESAENDETVTLLRRFASHLGLAFQIKDDILDVVSSAEELGKSVGKDERDDKSTFVTLLGFDEATGKLEEEINGAYGVLDSLALKDYKTDDYRAFVKYLEDRGN